MQREYRPLLSKLHCALDLLLTVFAFIIAYWLKKYLLPGELRGLTSIPNYHTLMLLIIIIWYPSLWLHGVYKSYRSKRLSSVQWQTLKALSVGITILTLFLYVFKISEVSRLFLGMFFLIDLVLIVAAKSFIYFYLQQYRSKGYNQRNLLIIGSGPRAHEIIDAINSEPWAGYRVMGWLSENAKTDRELSPQNHHITGTYEDLEHVLFNNVVDEIIFASDLLSIPNVRKYIALADEMGITTRILPQWNLLRLNIKPQIGSVRYMDLLELPTLTICSTPELRGEILLKTLFDYAISVISIILTLPITLSAAFFIKLLSPQGPVLFRQRRVGQNGREFTLYKFRTMAPDAEERQKDVERLNESDGPVFKIRKDPRVVPYIGSFLRRSGLDELPQLINVLKGELSIVGPRPPLLQEVKCYQYWQRRRLSMKPGLTCFWQIQPKRNDVSFEEWMRMDLAYIDNWSLWLDFKIMARTVWVMASGEGR